MAWNPDSNANGSPRSRTICLLCQDASDMGLRHYLFAEIIESFKNVIERHGYVIELIPSHGPRGLSYLGHCRKRRADGVFIVNADHESPESRELMGSDLPKIAIDYRDDAVGCVMTDCDKAMDLLYGHLYALGHRDIVYVHGQRKHITDLRIRALRRAMEARGQGLRPEQLLASHYYSRQAGYDAMAQLMGREHRPTAVIACDDYSAIGMLQATGEMGRAVPRDISLVGFDGIELGQLISPKLTTIRQDTAGMGAKAAESLLKQMLGIGRRAQPQTIVLEPQWIPGASTLPLI